MTSTESWSTLSTATSSAMSSAMSSTMSPTMSSNSSPVTPNNTESNNDPIKYRTALMVIYSVVLVSGIISLSLMMHFLKSSSISTTSIAVLNLIFAHFIFLITVPFRIYYYVTQEWKLSHGWCKVVSGMIHIHMYMSFAFYVIILITRQMMFYRKGGQLACFQRIHALLLSAIVWTVVLVTVPCIIRFSYGVDNGNNSSKENVCFNFAKNINNNGGQVFNYITSTLIIVVSTVLTALQANVLRVVYRRHQGCTSQQDFGAQLKSLCFALVMAVCFIPYHMFRLHYLEHTNMQDINEVFLSVTTFNCLDMLTFLGRRSCYMCFLGKGVFA